MYTEPTVQYLFSQNLSPTIVERFFAKVRKTETCWIWTGSVTGPGPKYGQINGIWSARTNKWHPIRAHKLSWIIHKGPIPEKLCVLHNCPGGDNPLCVNPDHLWLGNHKENADDAVSKGVQMGTPGEKHPSCKLTEAQVLEIRRIYASGDHHITSLGERFGVSKHQIFMIVSRRKWRSVNDPRDLDSSTSSAS